MEESKKFGKSYYNETEPFAADWLVNLAAQGHIAPGVVDRRSICDLVEADVSPHVQAHFFAGIGGWSYALRLAGWPDDVPVWTGSCPCQPFSTAGKHGGFDDERHLWPDWFRLIQKCRPPIIFGEQVANGAAFAWFDLVSTDLEREGYAVGAASLCAASVGAPHVRQRLFWVANAPCEGGCRRNPLEKGRRAEFRGPSKDICSSTWVDGRGRGSTLAVADVCSPSYGVPSRVGRLRAYGNAIVPQVAATFIKAVMDTL